MSKPTIGQINQYAERKKSSSLSFRQGIFHKPNHVVTKINYKHT